MTSNKEVSALTGITRPSPQVQALYDTVTACYGVPALGMCDVDAWGWTIHAGDDDMHATVAPMGEDAFVCVLHQGFGNKSVRESLAEWIPYASIGFEEALEIVTKPLKEKYHEQ